MIIDNLRTFSQRNDKFKFKLMPFLELQNLSKADYDKTVDILCEFLMDPDTSRDVSQCFPQILLMLLSTAIVPDSLPRDIGHADDIHRLNCTILGKLINEHPDVLGFALRYFESNPAPFETVNGSGEVLVKRYKSGNVKYKISPVSDLNVASACYNILRSAPQHFKEKWNWSNFYKYLKSTDENIRWIALKCMSIVLDISESLFAKLAKTFFDDFEKFLIATESKLANPMSSASPISSSELNDLTNQLTCVTPVGGILLPVLRSEQRDTANTLIPVPSMEENLQSLAVAVASRKCVCLQGPVGCGKTALVEYLAKVTGHGPTDFVKVQLGDQTDSKMLLGTYRCTDIPGEFVWQPGVLTRAATTGKWLLLEDIDSAASDVSSILNNLIETGTLSVPGYRDTIYVRTDFQLFLTQRLIATSTGLRKQSSSSTSLLEKNWQQINVEPLSKTELVTIIQTLFPVLSTIATRMVEVFLLFSMGNHGSDSHTDQHLIMKTGRLTSTRDLMKWCNRSITDFVVSSPESALKVFQDAIDIFCCSVSDQDIRLNLAAAIGHTLGIVKTKAEYFCNVHKPSINLNSDYFIAGRARVQCKKSIMREFMYQKSNFSFTRPSTCLLERITCCVARKEPVLLVGETGTGKTSSIQYLARSTGHKLIVINMNQQSESTDLLGGYKPVDIKFLITPIREEFEMLFRSYFAVEPNRKFLDHVATCYDRAKWKTLVRLMSHSASAAVKRLKEKVEEEKSRKTTSGLSPGSKREYSTLSEGRGSSRSELSKNEVVLRNWQTVLLKLQKLESQVKTRFTLAFAFIEGSLIKALQNGSWVLLDEINLANAETLECLSGLLEGSCGSLSLIERGDEEPIKRHPDFTLFACMNPATDVGKKELPVGLRNRFTELFVDELTERTDLQLLVGSYLRDLLLSPARQEAIVKFYLNVRKEAVNSLSDGTAHKPHYSLRTLCRALSVAASNPCASVPRSLYEAFCLSFLTQLDHASYPVVQKMIAEAVVDKRELKAILGAPIPKPRCTANGNYINFQGYWVVAGTLEPEIPANYILTDSVRRNLKDLVRVVSIGKMPVLLQGDTSVGKTSLITYLAKASGHPCVRINNHEHTDLQEYVGSYAADDNGKLVFKEGVLIEAMRKGHWIILDELNLAPSDVLEALNRVLDDNREIFIPETQQTVKAHENFMLFATQNPPGLYGGRKVLSRAFRNRFVELHFNDIPPNELQIILHERCHMPDSYCKQIINVMTDLQIRRKSTAAFAGKQGFITLRDLFRWGERYRLAPDVGNKLYDWSQHLADEGYLVLAAKVRKREEADEIRQVIKKHLKRDVDPSTLFTLNEKTSPVTKSMLEKILTKGNDAFKHVVWTYHMRRLAVLVGKACEFREPVLLVGETGGGKTTICQVIAAAGGKKLYAVNCHMHTESSDFVGSLRPVRNHTDAENQKLFEWVDGPLIEAMMNGHLFLADEISLADDSVLERLNSLLEPERSLLLSEKGVDSGDGNQDSTTIIANESFHFIGTMNPGGDYGKKELSPALRNRFTEIWCDGCTERDDLRAIIEHNLNVTTPVSNNEIALLMLDFVDWLTASEIGRRFTTSIRDILTWVNFMNTCCDIDNLCKLDVADAYLHGAFLTYVDGLGSGLTSNESPEKVKSLKNQCRCFLEAQIARLFVSGSTDRISTTTDGVVRVMRTDAGFGIEPFFIRNGPFVDLEGEPFTFTAPTTGSNALKLLRGLQLTKPLLMEGSPGVGKTSLVSALSKISGHKLLRINLSEQTDVSDLFGADLPVEGGRGGEFAWRDGPFLQALRAGHWILLDELNLASQSVLEGLNACLDHRGEVYIPELGRTFSVKPGTKLFACQNPLRQGGARRGLPKSFLNRFTQVFIDALSDADLKFIVSAQFPQLPEDLISKMVSFNAKLASEAGVIWGHRGAPWEMNLRDIVRWCEATIRSSKTKLPFVYNPGSNVELIYLDRMRTKEDKLRVKELYFEIFCAETYPLPPARPLPYITRDTFYLGDVSLKRSDTCTYDDDNLLLLRHQTRTLKSLMQCIDMNWMSILVGGSGSGKTSVVHLLAKLTGHKLRSIAVNSTMDTTEILGGFEQTDYNRHFEELMDQVETLLKNILRNTINKENISIAVKHHGLLEDIRNLSNEGPEASTMAVETNFFLRKVKKLSELIVALKSLSENHKAELESVENRLNRLMNLVEQDKCLNAGGKFEWVDSILVKCLQEGSWLLIDQINLCSPAVLDRLNGLLEPNGVLSIGERGVDAEGNLVVIKPHKNFRLFMAMDPRYGEISRAMRNRGVEIYMLGDEDEANWDILDLESLLYNAGLEGHERRLALLKIHQEASQNIKVGQPTSVVHLLQAAFLINQQISRGFSEKRAFESAGVDVYLKSRFVNEASTKIYLTSAINETMDSLSKEPMLEYLDVDSITWSSRHLEENSTLTVIRQQGAVLTAAIKMRQSIECQVQNIGGISSMSRFLNDAFGLRNSEIALDVDVTELLPYLLLNYYETSSRDDATLRHSWLSQILKDDDFSRKLATKSAKLADIITEFEFASIPPNIPWDSTILLHKSNGNGWNSNDLHRPHILTILLNIEAFDMTNGQQLLAERRIAADEKIITVSQYSNYVHHGKLTTSFTEHPLVLQFAPLLAQLDKCIDLALKEDAMSMEARRCVELKQKLRWRERFHRMGYLILINKQNSSKENKRHLEEALLLLQVHYKWLTKFIANFMDDQFIQYLGNSCREEIETLFRMIRTINDEAIIKNNAFQRLAKRVRKYLNLPLPCSSHVVFDVYPRLQSLSATYSTFKDKGVVAARQNLRLTMLQTPQASETRATLINFWGQIHSNSNLEEDLLIRLSELERLTEENRIALRTPVEIEEASTLVRTDTEKMNNSRPEKVQLWPVYEHFFIILANALRRRILRNLVSEERETVGPTFNSLSIFNEISSIPTDVLAILDAVTSNFDAPSKAVKMLPELFFRMVKFIDHSSAVKNSAKLLRWNGLDDGYLGATAAIEDEVATDYPIYGSGLVSLISELIFNNSVSKDKSMMAVATLGTYRARVEQLTTLNEMLWRNAAALNSKDYRYRLNDTAVAETCSSSYLAANKKAMAEIEVGKEAERYPAANPKSPSDTEIDYSTSIRELEELVNKCQLEPDELIVGKLWTLMGYVQICVFTNLGYIDPVHKVGLKLRYVEEDIAHCRKTIYTAELVARLYGDCTGTEDDPPRIRETFESLKELVSQKDTLLSSNAVRPEFSEFLSLVKETADFRNTLGSRGQIKRHVGKLADLVRAFREDPTMVDEKVAKNVVREVEMWEESVRRFSENIERKYLPGYPDLTLPLLSATSQMKYGMKILSEHAKRVICLLDLGSDESSDSGESSLDTLICNLVRFPTIGEGQESLVSLVGLMTDDRTKEVISKKIGAINGFAAKQELFRMIKCGLMELKNEIALRKNLSKYHWEFLNYLLQQVVLIWKQQQKEQEQREIEKESLFKNKTRLKGESLTEEQEITAELRKLFPRHRERDFSDIDHADAPTLENRIDDEEDESCVGLVTSEDIEAIHELHASIVRSSTTSQWVRKDSSRVRVDYVRPLLERYRTFGLLINDVQQGLSDSPSKNLYTSLNFLVTLTAASSEGLQTTEDSNSPGSGKGTGYDFYEDQNVEEAKQCLPVLAMIRKRIQELLDEWPEHPSLRSIDAIIQRIHSFPVTSPISRFLTGLELLLTKMQEWEENAHSGVSLSQLSLELTRQIIAWRRMELSRWKDCLNIAYRKLKSGTSKWWFYLYTLVESYMTKSHAKSEKDEVVTRDKLVEALHLFMNTSTLGEYSSRLDLLYTYHCHVCNFEPTQERDELSSILWNLHKYYDQFTETVSSKVSAAKAPIEKKLKDFVKIARWNDVSYWAVKETVEKTHRTLHKFVREFETKLKQPVAFCLIVPPSKYELKSRPGIWDRAMNGNEVVINPKDFVVKKIIQIEKDDSAFVGVELLPKVDHLFAKAKKLCSLTILMCSYPGMRTNLEDYVHEVMNHASHLKNLEIDATLPKPKQKSLAKSILQQKKMALANHFKALSLIGLSYRIGLMKWEHSRDDVLDVVVPPVNLEAAFGALKQHRIDADTLKLWGGCDKYYYKSLVKLDALNGALTSNQTDLGLQNIQRCRGFSMHAMILAHAQKRTLAESLSYFLALRMLLADLSKVDENSACAPAHAEVEAALKKLEGTLSTLAHCLEQLKLYLRACPRERDANSETRHDVFVLPDGETPITVANRGDIAWENANSVIEGCLDSVKKLANKFYCMFHDNRVVFDHDDDQSVEIFVRTSTCLSFLNESSEAIEKITTRLEEFEKFFASSEEAAHPLLENIAWLKSQIRENAETIKKLTTADIRTIENVRTDVDNVVRFKEDLEQVINSILIAVQRQYKTSMAYNEEPIVEDVETENDQVENPLEEKLLSEKLIGSLKTAIRGLSLKDVFQGLNNLVRTIQKEQPSTAAMCNRLLIRCLPLVEQYTLLVQFLLNEQVAAFRVTSKILYMQLDVFLDLATNGFCVPKDLDLEEGETENSQEGVDKGGMGLGDGEGEKDVSDRIETEDQLEDARPETAEERKNEDKDCKEEETGIDMSEDFDSKLQDLEKKEGEEDDEKDDEDKDLDKEMGETENDADKLDKEIWGADDEEEEEENEEGQEKEEESGKGEDIGEKELSAKTEEMSEEKEPEQRDQPGVEEEEKKEINEMDEPDVNDDQIDPYFGKHQPEPEPEPMDLPDDMNLDDTEAKEDNQETEENPFDIDTMKEAVLPEEPKEPEPKEDTAETPAEEADSSDEEDPENGDKVTQDNVATEMEDQEAKDEEEPEEEAPDSDKKAGKEPPEEEDKNEETAAEDENKEQQEQAQPSHDAASKETDAAKPVDTNDGGSRDKAADPSMNEQSDAAEENSQLDDNDKGTGQAQSEQQDQGHSGSSAQQSVPISRNQLAEVKPEKRKNPGETDDDRTLVNEKEPDKKKLKTIGRHEEDKREKEDEGVSEKESVEAEMYQHIKSTEKFDEQTVDAATEDQVKEQATNLEDATEIEKEVPTDVEMHEEEDPKEEEGEQRSREPDELTETVEEKDKTSKSNEKRNTDNGQVEMTVEVDGETTDTARVSRGGETTFHTNILEPGDSLFTSSKLVEHKRREVEAMLGQWSNVPPNEEATAAWNCLGALTDGPARDLSEKLRLVLEPTQASRLKGDYRTGRRINMRKVIPYIASQFRKDKIWLRRTKPSKRDYQIVLALDDSSSMADNHSKELAFESLSLISKAMTYLEIGQLCVVNFGESTNVLHPLGDQFTEQSGAKLIQRMTFEQTKTKVGQLVDFTVDMFGNRPISSDNAKLLVVLSDGRGIFSEGIDKVNSAVRRARMADIFLVFIIVDNPINRDSILDIRMPVFEGGKLTSIRSYMDSFPFPFYMILREIDALPSVLSDALRQWFEIVGKIDA